MPQGWLVTGVGWAGDPREAARATVLACSGPSLLDEGPADLVFVAEEPGLGLGNRYAGLAGADPGPYLADALTNTAAHAKLKAAGHPTPLWTVQTKPDRSVYIGEAKGFWLYAIAWPQVAGYLLSEVSALDDLSEWLPSELTFGAPSPYLHGRA
jgi:hypothetical protein